MANTVDLYDQGLTALLEKLGVVKTVQFIALVKRENFDYTKNILTVCLKVLLHRRLKSMRSNILIKVREK
jgi:hypothetical protein